MNRFLDQLEIQPDATRLDVARTPPGFHLFHPPLGHLHADDRFPFRNQRSNLLLEPSTIPGSQDALAHRGIATGPHEEIHGLVVAKAHYWRALVILHIEQVTVPLIIVALAAHKLTG